MSAFLKAKWTAYGPLFILSACVFLAYGNAFQNKFLWDDEFLIDENTYITSFNNLDKVFSSSSTSGFGTTDSFYRPLQMVIYMFAYAISGSEETLINGRTITKKIPWAYHLCNTLLHLGNAWLLYFLFFTIWKSQGLALVSSLFWAVHPVHTEAITYMSGTADPLSVFFILGATLLFLRSQDEVASKTLLVISSLGLFLCALLSKEAIIIFPGLLMIVIFFKPAQRRQWKKYLATFPFWFIALSYFFARKTFLNFDKTFEFFKTSNIYTENWLYRLYTFAATLPEYLKMLIYPVDLHMERQFPVFIQWSSIPVLIGFLIAALGILALWIYRKKEKSKAYWAVLWFFIAFVPMSGILIPVNSFLLEHWLYLPSMGLFLLVGAASLKIHKISPKGAIIVVICLASTLVALTRKRNLDWKDPITFYTNVLSYTKGTSRIHNNIAMAYADQKKWSSAIYHYNKSILISDTYPQPHYNLARIFIRQGKNKIARTHLQRSLEIDPRFHFAQKLLRQLEEFQKIRASPQPNNK